MTQREPLPRDGSIDATPALLREGYDFISRRCSRLRTDGFRTRLMLTDALCLTGPDAVEMIYSASGLTRRGAMPFWVLRLLQDRGSVQQLEGSDHRRRKRLFIDLLITEPAAEDLAARFSRLWMAAAAERPDRFEVLRGTSRLLARAAAEWAGLPEEDARSPRFADALFDMSDRTGSIGPTTWAALAARRRVERRLRDLVERVRLDGAPAPTPLARLASHTEADGKHLGAEVVAVEALNLLRPIVAVGRYVAFAVDALHRHPQWRDRIRDGDDDAILPFCQEVRRLSPFFPLTTAIATDDIRFRDVPIGAGQWVLVDLFGTCRNPDAFAAPLEFRPERPWHHPRAQRSLVPQGGGDVATGHRCPGERVTLGLMAEAVRLACRSLDYAVPDQDLEVRHSRVPAQPASGVVLEGLRPRAPVTA